MNLLKQFGAILRKFLNVLARLEMLHGLFLILLLHIKHVPVEGRLDEGTDGFLVEQLVVEFLTIRVRLKIDASFAYALLNLLR